MPAASSSFDSGLFDFLSADFFDLGPLRSPAPSRSSLSKSFSSASSDRAVLEGGFGGSFVDGSSPRTRATLEAKQAASAAIASRLARRRDPLISLPPHQHPARRRDRARVAAHVRPAVAQANP